MTSARAVASLVLAALTMAGRASAQSKELRHTRELFDEARAEVEEVLTVDDTSATDRAAAMALMKQ
jgi:hypothetical protein